VRPPRGEPGKSCEPKEAWDSELQARKEKRTYLKGKALEEKKEARKKGGVKTASLHDLRKRTKKGAAS